MREGGGVRKGGMDSRVKGEDGKGEKKDDALVCVLTFAVGIKAAREGIACACDGNSGAERGRWQHTHLLPNVASVVRTLTVTLFSCAMRTNFVRTTDVGALCARGPAVSLTLVTHVWRRADLAGSCSIHEYIACDITAAM